MRDWLEKNKVFFEVIAALLISIASFVVSWSSLKVSEKTLAATEVTSLPHFSVQKQPKFDPRFNSFTEDWLIVSNHGAPVYNTSVKIATFFAFRRYSATPEVIYIPISGYYNIQYASSTPTGELTKATDAKNLDDFTRIYSSGLDAAKKSQSEISPIPELVAVLEIKYKDRFNNDSKTYFINESIASSESAAKFMEFFNKTPPLEIHSASINDFVNALDSGTALRIRDAQ